MRVLQIFGGGNYDFGRNYPQETAAAPCDTLRQALRFTQDKLRATQDAVIY